MLDLYPYLNPGAAVWTLAGFAAVLGLAAPALDRFILPEPMPGPEYVPPAGYRFVSEAEGVTQRILRHENGLLWLESTLAPFAPGPPLHIHGSLPERFRCERGVVSLQVGSEVIQLHAGEEFLVSPGTPHRPFNATAEEAVIRGLETPDYALPAHFGVFLSQIYAFIDEDPKHAVPPRVILQMSRFAPAYDIWLADSPLLAQRAMFWVLGPVARMLGYRAYYPQYSPGAPVFSSRTSDAARTATR